VDKSCVLVHFEEENLYQQQKRSLAGGELMQDVTAGTAYRSNLNKIRGRLGLEPRRLVFTLISWHRWYLKSGEHVGVYLAIFWFNLWDSSGSSIFTWRSHLFCHVARPWKTSSWSFNFYVCPGAVKKIIPLWFLVKGTLFFYLKIRYCKFQIDLRTTRYILWEFSTDKLHTRPLTTLSTTTVFLSTPETHRDLEVEI
jgi:hypothetical protein